MNTEFFWLAPKRTSQNRKESWACYLDQWVYGIVLTSSIAQIHDAVSNNKRIVVSVPQGHSGYTVLKAIEEIGADFEVHFHTVGPNPASPATMQGCMHIIEENNWTIVSDEELTNLCQANKGESASV